MTLPATELMLGSRREDAMRGLQETSCADVAMASPGAVRRPVDDGDRYTGVRQYSLSQIIGVWAAAVVPMGILAWVVAPWISHRLSDPEPIGQAVLLVFNVGLIWVLALTLLLVRGEQAHHASPVHHLDGLALVLK